MTGTRGTGMGHGGAGHGIRDTGNGPGKKRLMLSSEAVLKPVKDIELIDAGY